MKLLHTADWHLGKRLDSISRMEEQRTVLAEICEIADREKVDAVLIAGDLFDTFNPATDAVDLFYKTLKKLTKGGTRPVIAIAGNHDSPDRIEAPDPLARECGIIFAGYPQTEILPFELETGVKVTKSAPGFIEISLPQHKYPLRLLLTPYANEYRMKTFLGTEDRDEELRVLLAEEWSKTAEKYCDNKGVNVLMTHLFVKKKEEEQQAEPDAEKPILHVGGAQAIYTENFPDQIQYVALGHLHRRQTIDTEPCPIVYSSSILAYSFAEANQDKNVILVEIEPNAAAKVEPIKLTAGKKLMRKRFEEVDNAVEWLSENQDTLVELTMVADDFLTSQNRKRLHTAHQGIVTIIPEIKNKTPREGSPTAIDLNRPIDELFSDYFKSKNGVNPNEEIMDLFKEVLGT